MTRWCRLVVLSCTDANASTGVVAQVDDQSSRASRFGSVYPGVTPVGIVPVVE